MKRLLLFFLLLFPFAITAFAQTTTKVKTVCIDPGHGGKDPGALGKIAKEKDIALKIALKLGNYIEKNIPGVKVVYTRKTDVFVTLNDRAKKANNSQADLFISIHTNSTKDNASVTGTETYIYGQSSNKESKALAMFENSVAELEDDYLDVYGDILSLYESDDNLSKIQATASADVSSFVSGGERFANLVQNEFETRAKRGNRGVKRNIYLVLRQTQMPSVLVECGFISNKEEEKFMASDYGQDILASAIFRAFRDYCGIPKPTSSSDNLKFRIQLKSLSKRTPLNSSELKGIVNVEELYIDGKFLYVVGKETSYKKISDQLATIRKQIPDAFVIAVRNGKEKVDVGEAKKELGQ